LALARRWSAGAQQLARRRRRRSTVGPGVSEFRRGVPFFMAGVITIAIVTLPCGSSPAKPLCTAHKSNAAPYQQVPVGFVMRVARFSGVCVCVCCTPGCFCLPVARPWLRPRCHVPVGSTAPPAGNPLSATILQHHLCYWPTICPLCWRGRLPGP